MKDLICPHCGAEITARVCEYCGCDNEVLIISRADESAYYSDPAFMTIDRYTRNVNTLYRGEIGRIGGLTVIIKEPSL